MTAAANTEVAQSADADVRARHATLAEALVAAQAAMPKVEPDAVNPHFKSKFVSLDHLIAKTRPVLNAHGLAITQWPTVAAATDSPALLTILTHVSGESMRAVMPLIVGKNDMQGLGGAISYARRYMWAAVLGICADEDDDGNQASRPEVRQEATGASRTRSRSQSAPDTALANSDDLAAYKVAVEDAGLDWAAAFAALEAESNPVTAEALAKHRGQLAAYLEKAASAVTA